MVLKTDMRDGLLEMFCRDGRSVEFQIFAAQAETQQCAIAARCEQAFEIGNGSGIHAQVDEGLVTRRRLKSGR